MFFFSELKRSLDQFVTKETAKLHDENAEEVIKKVKTGVVSAQSLIDRWNKAFTEVILLFCAREREIIYLTTHSTHFIYGYMALRTILIVRKETHCCHIGYSYRLIARVLLYAPSHRQDNTYHSLCYTCHGALAGTRNSSMGPPYEGSIRQPIAP